MFSSRMTESRHRNDSSVISKHLSCSLHWVSPKRDVHHPCVRHNSFMCETWLIHVWDMTYSCMTHDSFMCDTWLIHVWHMTHSCVTQDSFMCDTWLIHAYIAQPTLCVTWLNRVCAVTCLDRLCDVTRSYVTWLIYVCDMIQSYVTWSIPLIPKRTAPPWSSSTLCEWRKCEMTHPPNSNRPAYIVQFTLCVTWLSNMGSIQLIPYPPHPNCLG